MTLDKFTEPETITAYIDMEFGDVYGSHQRINIPIEVGSVIYHPKIDKVSFAVKKFSYDIDVEQWKNRVDDLGRTIERKNRVFNIGKSDISLPYDKKFSLDKAGRKRAYKISGQIHKNLNGYMQNLIGLDVRTLVFFAKERDNKAITRAKFDTDMLIVRDLQEEITKACSLKDHISLDRLSYIIKFRISSSIIRSEHYTYRIPEKYRYLVKPHKGIGDAARMFILAKELYHHADKLKEKIEEYLELCKKESIISKKNQ